MRIHCNSIHNHCLQVDIPTQTAKSSYYVEMSPERGSLSFSPQNVAQSAWVQMREIRLSNTMTQLVISRYENPQWIPHNAENKFTVFIKWCSEIVLMTRDRSETRKGINFKNQQRWTASRWNLLEESKRVEQKLFSFNWKLTIYFFS